MFTAKYDNLSDYVKDLKILFDDLLKSGDEDYLENNAISNATEVSRNIINIKTIKDKEITDFLHSTDSKTKITFLVKKRKGCPYKKKHPNKNYGRKKNDLKEKGETGKHTQNDATNGKKRAIIHCIHSYYSEIKYLFPEMKLLEITITNQLGKDEDLKNLFNLSIKDIIFKSKPRKRDEPKYFENKISEIINSKNENVKILNILLMKKLREIMIMYLKGTTSFEYFEEGNSLKTYYLKKFKTFEEGLNNVTIKAKKKIKDNLLNLLGYEKDFNKIKLNEVG